MSTPELFTVIGYATERTEPEQAEGSDPWKSSARESPPKDAASVQGALTRNPEVLYAWDAARSPQSADPVISFGHGRIRVPSGDL
jgi:hypothetical protein